MTDRSGLTEPLALILIGPMGCGKSTVGGLLAQRLGWPFWDADDYHPPENKAKMKAGIPLSDADRRPWLDLLRDKIEAQLSRGQNVVLACSALKESYRNRLGVDQKRIRSIYLHGTPDLLQERIALRSHPYMPTGLLASQLTTFEAPRDGLIVDISESPEQIVDRIMAAIPVTVTPGEV